MKKTIENVIQVLSLRENENCKFNIYDKDVTDIQVAFENTSIPLVYDVRGILSCFFTNAQQITHIDNFFGFTEIFLSYGNFIKGKVDLEMLKLYIPNNKFNELKKIK